jgi:hypothetical protein
VEEVVVDVGDDFVVVHERLVVDEVDLIFD